MTVSAVITRLKDEKQQSVPARFHCRAIMVQNINQYCELIEQLKGIPGTVMVSLDDLFSGDDVMPDYGKLCQKEYEDKWLILPGVSEYLRLFHVNEENAQRLSYLWHFQFDAKSTGRILIPLWGCETLWFDKSLHLNDDERQKDYLFNCIDQTSDAQLLDVQVLSHKFQQYVDQIRTENTSVFFGLKEWYGFWYNPKSYNNVKQLIITNRFKSVKATEGDIHIHVVDDMTAFIVEKMHNGNLINSNNCSQEVQEYLFESALEGLSLDEAILHILNINEIKPIDIMSKWNMLSIGKKELVLLWYKLHPDSSYLCHCTNSTNDIDDLTKHILLDIFSVYLNHREWIEESRQIVDVVPLNRSDDFFTLLDKIPSFEDRLNFLSSRELKERIYILHLIGEWLRADKEAVFQCSRLKMIYPALIAYLSEDYSDELLNSYFGKYKLYKLSNTLPQSEELYFDGIDPEEFDFRYPILSAEANSDTKVLWIDALGAEWLPLLKWSLGKNCCGHVDSCHTVQSQLPSETCFNEQWLQMTLPYEKYNKLDKLAHKGVIDDKDYYACIEEQIRFVSEIASIVNNLLKEYSRVIITGDHGTSRLAARFFHINAGLPIPNQASVGSHGRFCKVKEKPTYVASTQRLAEIHNEYYLVYSNYDHYVQSGFAAGADDDVPIYGEIHGGASPEEMLVPVISVSSKNELAIQANWRMQGNQTKVSNKKVCCQIHFSKPVSVVQASIGSAEADTQSTDIPSQDWSLTFSGIKVDKTEAFEVTVIADGKLVKTESIMISPALGGGDPF